MVISDYKVCRSAYAVFLYDTLSKQNQSIPHDAVRKAIHLTENIYERIK